MDFHSLPRRSLQFLCKKNKIPANMTNIAMADALRALQSVEGVVDIMKDDQTPIKTLTRQPNPPRGCRTNSSLVSRISTNLTKRATQELANISTSKRTRTVSPGSAISRKKSKTEDVEEEEDPIGKAPPFNTLVCCRERSVCLKTYNGKRWDGSLKLVEGISLREPILGCNASVRRNASTTESAELAIGGVVECVQVGEERRSIGVQVDIRDIDNCVPEISAIRDRTPSLAYNDGAAADMKDCTAPQNYVEVNPFLALVKEGQEIATSCLLPINDIPESSRVQTLRLATHFPEPTPESAKIPSTGGDLICRKQTPLLETGDPIVKSLVSVDNIGSCALNSVPVFEDSEADKRGFCYIHSYHGVDTVMEKENEEAKRLDKEFISRSGLRNLRVATYFQERNPESSNMPSNAVYLIGSHPTPLPENADPILTSHDDSIRNLALNCGPVLDDIIGSCALNSGPVFEDSVGKKRGFDCIHSDHGVDADMEKVNEETNKLDKEFINQSGLQNLRVAAHFQESNPESTNMLSDPGHLTGIQQTPLPEFADPILSSHESDDSIGSLALNCGPILEDSGGEQRGFGCIHNNHGEDTGMEKENEELKSHDKECIDSSGLQNLQLAIHFPEPCPERSNRPLNFGEFIGSQQTPLLVIANLIVKSHECDDSIGSHALNCPRVLEENEGVKRGFGCTHSLHREDTNLYKENEMEKNGEGMTVEIKKEKQSEKKRDLSGLSLRKLRLLFKENKEVIKIDAEGGCGKEDEVHCEEKQSIEKANLGGLSLGKLKVLYKNMASNKQQLQELGQSSISVHGDHYSARPCHDLPLTNVLSVEGRTGTCACTGCRLCALITRQNASRPCRTVAS